MKRWVKTLPSLALGLTAFLLLVLVAAPIQAQPASPVQGGSIVRFVVTGDTRGDDNGVNTTILAELVQATIAEGANFILVPGDLVNGNQLQSELIHWRNIMQPLYAAGIGVYPCRGNHDDGSKAVWDAVFSGAYALPGNGPSGEKNVTYSFTYGNILVIALDEYAHNGRVNQAWLNAQLAANTQPHIFVFGHLPAFSVYHSDTLASYPAERDAFWNSLAAVGGRTYFAGHDHLYNHARLDDGDGNPDDDVHQLVVGTGGAPLYSWGGNYAGDNGAWTPQRVYDESDYGYSLVEVDGLQVTITWKHRVSPGVYQATGDIFSYTVIPPLEPLSGVLIDGPAAGVVNTGYTYNAKVSPIYATLPITYTWAPAPDGGQGTATVIYTWTATGSKTISVTAQNEAGAATASCTVAIGDSSPPMPLLGCTRRIYLPVILKQAPQSDTRTDINLFFRPVLPAMLWPLSNPLCQTPR